MLGIGLLISPVLLFTWLVAAAGVFAQVICETLDEVATNYFCVSDEIREADAKYKRGEHV